MTCSAITNGRPCFSHAASGNPYCPRHTRESSAGNSSQPSVAISASAATPSPASIPEESRDRHGAVGAAPGARGEGTRNVADTAHADPRGPDADQRGFDVKTPARAYARRLCAGTTRRGDPCRFTPPRDEDYCLNHQPGADTAAAAGRASEAARIARIRKSPSVELLSTVISLNDRTAIQATLDTVIRLQLAGRLENESARIILRACSIAARNFDAARETLEGPQPQHHPWDSYLGRVKATLNTIDPLLQQALNNDEDDE